MQIDILHRKLIKLLEIELAVPVSSNFFRFLAIFRINHVTRQLVSKSLKKKCSKTHFVTRRIRPRILQPIAQQPIVAETAISGHKMLQVT